MEICLYNEKLTDKQFTTAHCYGYHETILCIDLFTLHGQTALLWRVFQRALYYAPQVYTPGEGIDIMSTLASTAVLERIAALYRERDFNLSTVPANSVFAELFLDSGDAKVAVQKTTPQLYTQAVASLEKQVSRLAQGRSLPGASKLLRLRQRAKTLGVDSQALTSLIEREADRLIERALVLSARHGAKARVRLSTLSALTQAGFIETDDLNAVKTAMMSSQMVSNLVAKTNGDENLRWKMYRASSLPTSEKKAKKRKPMICKASRREAGVKVQKPLTKAAFLLLKDSFGNPLPASAKKQAIKAERTAKAQQRRRGFKANGGAKVGGPGEGVTVRQPVADWCKAGHAGTKVAK